MYRGGLDRFKKAQSLEPFSVAQNNNVKPAVSKPAVVPPVQLINKQSPQIPDYVQNQQHVAAMGIEAASQEKPVTQIGGGQSTWQPPDWAIEPRPGVYYLDVMKDGEVLDRINLDKRKHIFGRQLPTCDFVLDHQSVSRQHAAVVPHSNGSVFVIDMGSVHGTFVANERLTKDNPVELEVGQSLRFAASTRTYILRKNAAVLFPTQALPSEVNLPSPPDPSDEDAVVAYNTLLNRYGLTRLDISSTSKMSSGSVENLRPTKKRRKSRVAFRDQVGGSLVEIVGISDGADVETEPGPIGVKEGSLVGRYESLVQVTVIPKGKEQASAKEDVSHRGVTEKLQQVLNKVKSSKGGIYDDLYGDSIATKVGSSWAYKPDAETATAKTVVKNPPQSSSEKYNAASSAEDSDDLFGD